MKQKKSIKFLLVKRHGVFYYFLKRRCHADEVKSRWLKTKEYLILLKEF